MRQARLKAPEGTEMAFYHCVSRVVNRDFVFGEAEREQFVRLMRVYERFCGVRVVTYCVMSNHFHLLVGVPKKPEVMPANAELIQRVRASLGDLEARRLAEELAQAARTRSPGWEEEIRGRYLRRMWDISLFMKTLKQRFSQWFNRVHRRRGTLWEDRFRSVLVESAGPVLRTMAAYIDLNPVRAGLVEDPADYRWSGYGAAMGGDGEALEGLRELERLMSAGQEVRVVERALVLTKGRQVLARYRVLLAGWGEVRGRAGDGGPLRRGWERQMARRIVAQGGRLPTSVYLRCRVRYLTEGAVIGSRGYVNEVFEALRERFGARRRTGARLMRGMEEKLYALRDVKRGAVG
jgi:putative transposase